MTLHMKKQHIITHPLNSADLNTPLPPATNVPLAFPVVAVNTMLAGELSSNQFTAKVDGLFQFNISSQAQGVNEYRVRLKHGENWYEQRGIAGIDTRVCAQKNVTIPMRAGETVELFDYQHDANSGATRWSYSDTNRIEISFEG